MKPAPGSRAAVPPRMSSRRKPARRSTRISWAASLYAVRQKLQLSYCRPCGNFIRLSDEPAGRAGSSFDFQMDHLNERNAFPSLGGEGQGEGGCGDSLCAPTLSLSGIGGQPWGGCGVITQQLMK